MRRSSWRNGINVISCAILALTACGKPVRQVRDLGREIGQEFRRPIVVSVDRRTHLILIVPSPQGDTADPGTLARQVAEYAVKHYEHVGAIKNVTVIFDADNQAQASDSGAASSDSSAAPEQFSWAKDELSGKTRVQKAGTSALKSD